MIVLRVSSARFLSRGVYNDVFLDPLGSSLFLRAAGSYSKRYFELYGTTVRRSFSLYRIDGRRSKLYPNSFVSGAIALIVSNGAIRVVDRFTLSRM